MRYEADSVWLRALRRVHCDACTAMRTIFCNVTVARLRLAFARRYGDRSLRRLFLQRLAAAHPQKKEKARSDERA